LLGLAGSGKDVAAEILQRVLHEQGMHFEIKKYAGLLKEATRLAFGDNFDDRDVKEERVFVTPTLADKIIDATDYIWLKLGFGQEHFELFNDLCIKHIDSRTWMSPREFQQLLGTDVIRAIDPDTWVKYLTEQDGNYIISDVRFANELVDYNVLLCRHGIADIAEHVSEGFTRSLLQDVAHMDAPYLHDYTLWNNGTLEELERNIRFMVTTIDFSNYK
jgi:hypothetical protein